jgi:hypothetical protein
MAFLSDSNKTYGEDKTHVAKVLNSNGVEGALTVGTSAIELKVGSTPLEFRQSATLYNNSNSIIYWGYTSSVTTSTGTPIEKKQFVEWEVGDSRAIYLIAGSAGNNVRITEAS